LKLHQVTKALLGAIDQGQLPHLLFYGPPGTGKTSTILAVTRMLYHPSVLQDRVLEMNASDERGIKLVRDKIKAFSQRSVSSTKHEGYPSPPFKIVILDEADTMTKDAQGALRRTMETYSSVTRFCLVCNYVSRIIEPLVSRCAKMRFAVLDSKSMQAQLKKIAAAENVVYEERVYNQVLEYSQGDMRRAVTLFQSCVNLHGNQHVATSDLEEISDCASARMMQPLWSAIEAKDSDALSCGIDNMMLEGLSAHCVLRYIHDHIVNNTQVRDAQKAVICEALARAVSNLHDGADDQLQLHTACFAVVGA